MKILVLEPYHGASHKRFLDDLEKHLPFDFKRLTQPARAWKWRMRFAAPEFASRLAQSQDQEFDLILASTFLSLADFRGLAPAWVQEIPAIVYWHENQWAYPVQKEDARDRHFVITNFTSALSADLNLFNSEWNRSSLMAGFKEIGRAIPDTNIRASLEAIERKSRVFYPSLDFDIAPPKSHANKVPILLWNHRWEHDKNPEEFFSALIDLLDQKLDFQVIVAGQSFGTRPKIFDEAQARLKEQIIHWGHVDDRGEYEKLLRTADIVISTAHHEFFGLSVLEAAMAGARPCVPNHLSYPEIYSQSDLYPPGELSETLSKLLRVKFDSKRTTPSDLSRFTWKTQRAAWDELFRDVAARGRSQAL